MSGGPGDDTAPKGAVLDVLDKKGKVTKTIPVQFNPSSLRLTLSNSVDGGTSRGRQVQQYNGSSSTQLHVELEFDTADEGTTAKPVDVRDRTNEVAQFVLPAEPGSKQAPPRVQFRWGPIAVPGVMTSMVEELDYFSAEGVPLRAKVTIEIKQQDPRFEARPAPGSATPPPPAGEPDAVGNGPGTSGGPPSGPDTRTAEALDGESAADFLSRNDQPPEAWRAVAGLVGDALALAAGTSIDFSGSLSLGVGLGVSAGFETGLDVSVGAQAGLPGSAPGAASGPASGAAGAGFALSAVGGLTAAIELAAIEQNGAGVAGTRAAFGLPTAQAAPTVAPVAALGASSLPAAAATPRPLPPRADPRATSFGRGVPLRDRVVPDSAMPGTGGWVVVSPLRPSGYATATGTTASSGGCGCGCSSGCGCGAQAGGAVRGARPVAPASTASLVSPAGAATTRSARHSVGGGSGRVESMAPAAPSAQAWGRSRPRRGCCG